MAREPGEYKSVTSRAVASLLYMRPLLLLMIQEGTGRMRSYSMDLRERSGSARRVRLAARRSANRSPNDSASASPGYTGCSARRRYRARSLPSRTAAASRLLSRASPLSGSERRSRSPDATLEELRRATGVASRTSAVFRAARTDWVCLEKSPSGAAQQDRPELKARCVSLANRVRRRSRPGPLGVGKDRDRNEHGDGPPLRPRA